MYYELVKRLECELSMSERSGELVVSVSRSSGPRSVFVLTMKLRIILFVLFATTLSVRAVPKKVLKFPLWNETWVDRLRRNLLSKYDKFSRPTQHYNTTTVLVYLNIMHVEVDNRKNMLSVNTWVRMTWNDEKLKWNAKSYGGIEEISVGIHEIWQPDLYLYNSALHGIENYESRHCIVRQDGEVTWIAPTVFHSYCDFRLVLWPFETNTCDLSIGSWTTNGDEINIKLQDKGFDLQYYSGGEWQIQNVSARREVKVYSCCPSEPFVRLVYEIELSRSSELYYHVVFVASIPIVFLVLITFLLRPDSEMKLIMNICAIITDTLILLYLGQTIPARVNNLPLIVRFFSGCLYQMTLSTVISCVVIHISSSSYATPIPRKVRHLLYGKFGRILGLHSIIGEIESQKFDELQEVTDTEPASFMSTDLSISSLNNGDQDCIISQSKNVKRLEWILLVTAIDRISFILFCFTYIIIAIAYIRVNSDAFTNNLHLLHSSSSLEMDNTTSVDYF